MTILVTIFTVVFSLVVLAYGEPILRLVFGAVVGEEVSAAAWILLRWPIAMAMYFLMISYNYYILPSVRMRFRDIIPGSIFAAIGFFGRHLCVLDLYQPLDQLRYTLRLLLAHRRADAVVLVPGLGAVPGHDVQPGMVGHAHSESDSDSKSQRTETKTDQHHLSRGKPPRAQVCRQLHIV